MPMTIICVHSLTHSLTRYHQTQLLCYQWLHLFCANWSNLVMSFYIMILPMYYQVKNFVKITYLINHKFSSYASFPSYTLKASLHVTTLHLHSPYGMLCLGRAWHYWTIALVLLRKEMRNAYKHVYSYHIFAKRTKTLSILYNDNNYHYTSCY